MGGQGSLHRRSDCEGGVMLQRRRGRLPGGSYPAPNKIYAEILEDWDDIEGTKRLCLEQIRGCGRIVPGETYWPNADNSLPCSLNYYDNLVPMVGGGVKFKPRHIKQKSKRTWRKPSPRQYIFCDEPIAPGDWFFISNSRDARVHEQIFLCTSRAVFINVQTLEGMQNLENAVVFPHGHSSLAEDAACCRKMQEI